jgi:hypothetical protein
MMTLLGSEAIPSEVVTGGPVSRRDRYIPDAKLLGDSRHPGVPSPRVACRETSKRKWSRFLRTLKIQLCHHLFGSNKDDFGSAELEVAYET